MGLGLVQLLLRVRLGLARVGFGLVLVGFLVSVGLLQGVGGYLFAVYAGCSGSLELD